MTTNVLLDSEEGKGRLMECIGGHHATEVMQVWEQQSGRTFCGFQTLACMINSVEQTRVKDVELFRMMMEKSPDIEIDESTVLKEGITLDEFIDVARIITNTNLATSRVTIRQIHCNDNKDSIKRSLIVMLSDRSHTRIACNYHMSTAGQEPYGGHFSPLVAFHEQSDSFLILDVWPDTAPFWVKWELLW